MSSSLPSLLVTGASGFVGRHLLAALGREFPHTEIHRANFDMTAQAEIRAVVQAVSPDACIHLAAVSAVSVARQQPDVAWQVNLVGTLHLSRAIMELAPQCRLLFVSSADAYGRSFLAGSAVDESAALAPVNTYAATKAAADLAVGALVSEGLRAIRLRPFNHIGSGQSDAFVVAAFARQVARIEAGIQPPELHVGALGSRRDFLDVRDVCDAYIACLRRMDDLTPGTIFNVASGVSRRVGDILDDLLALSRTRIEVKLDASRLRPAEIPNALGNASLARLRLDWKPRIRWEETLADVLGDWRARVRG